MAQTDNGRALGVAFSKPTLDGLTVGGTALSTVSVVELGQAATDRVGFFGATASVQSAAIASIVSGTAATTATYGIPTPDAVAVIAAVNAITAALRSKGIIAT